MDYRIASSWITRLHPHGLPDSVFLSESEGSPADWMRSLRYGRDDRV